jgi:hypothetical protein
MCQEAKKTDMVPAMAKHSQVQLEHSQVQLEHSQVQLDLVKFTWWQVWNKEKAALNSRGEEVPRFLLQAIS